MHTKHIKHYVHLTALITGILLTGCNDSNDNNNNEIKVSAKVGPRPLFLVNQMQDSELKTTLEQCSDKPSYRTDFSIGHRGAAMQFPEHTKESYQAAIDSGAGLSLIHI